jgi:branched-chain amino acid transport system substrate-binding protein
MKLAVKIIGLATVGLLAGLTPALSSPLKIGFVTTLSGPGAAIGQDMVDGFKLGLKSAPANAPIEVIYEDDQLKPDVGRQVVNKLLERDRVDLITGMIWSNVLLATAKPILDSGTILISANAGPSQLAGKQCNPNYFSVAFQNDTPHEAMGQYAQTKAIKRVYLLAPNYPAGKDALAGFKRFYKGEVAGEVYTGLDQLDFSAELAQLRAAKPDAVYFFFAGAQGINFLKQFAQAGLSQEMALLGPVFSLDSIVLRAVGPAAQGAHVSTFWSDRLDNPANKKFVADFQAAYGRVPSSYAATSYDAATLILSAFAKTGGNINDRAAFRAALAKADFASVRGKFRFNTNQSPVQDFYVSTVNKDDKGQFGYGPAQRIMETHQDAYVGECKMSAR